MILPIIAMVPFVILCGFAVFLLMLMPDHKMMFYIPVGLMILSGMLFAFAWGLKQVIG